MNFTLTPEAKGVKVFVPWEIDKRRDNTYQITIKDDGTYPSYSGYTAELKLFYETNLTVTADDTLSTGNGRIVLPDIGSGINYFTLKIPQATAAAYTQNKLKGFMKVVTSGGVIEHAIDFTVYVT